jgi:hypothetical protein
MPGHAIGDAERFNRGTECDQGKFGNEKKRDALGNSVTRLAKHGSKLFQPI